jgi:PAS domain S-box-containing protein
VVYVSVSGAIAGVLIKRMQRENERARRANESILRSIQAAGLIGIFTWSNGTIIDANDAFLKMLGYTKDDLAGNRLRIADLTAPEYHLVEDQARRELDEKGRSRIFQAELIGKDGDRVVVVGGRARVEGDNRYGIGYALDITSLVISQREQKRLQEQLQRADRLNALGSLAGGIAHDFNNLLGVIVGYTALGQTLGPLDATRRETAEEVLKAAAKAKELIRKLLAFSQSHVLQAELLDVNAVLKDLEKMLGRILGDTIELRLHLGEDIGCIFADHTQIEQLVMNLVVNARDALPQGGVISITTDKVSVPSVAVGEDVEPGDHVSICVRDNGAGIDPAVLSQIFEPFFSTKKEIGGTGLGLAIVDGVVRQHRGHIRVKSQLGQGTEVVVRFPWAAASTAPTAPKPARQIEGGTETILVLEDSEETRRMLATILSSLGYKVLTAENGLRGVEVARQYQHEIHLVLSDIAMPQMSGPDAVEHIRRGRPNVRALLFTGFANSALLEGKSIPNGSILEKPIEPELLARKIREVLGPRRGEGS